MKKETVDLLEMMDIPLTKDLKDLLDQMDEWSILIEEMPVMPEIPYMPGYTWRINTTDVTYVTTDPPVVCFD